MIAAPPRARLVRALPSLACLVLLAACPMRGREGQELVGKIETRGNTALERDTLVGRIAHAESGLNFIGPIPAEAEDAPPDVWRFGPLLTWGDRHRLDPQLLLADAKRMERVYARRGFYDTQVEVLEPVVRDGRADLTFVVREGEPTRLVKVSVRFAENFAKDEERALVAAIGAFEGLQPGEPVDEERVEPPTDEAIAAGDERNTTRPMRAWPVPFTGKDRTPPLLDEDWWDDLKTEVLARVKAQGYPGAEVQGQVVVDRKTHTAVGTIDVLPGPKYRVERVVVFGSTVVAKQRVAQAAGVEAGDPITPRTLAEVQRRVYALGVFALVQVDLGLFRPDPGGRTGAAPVVVTLNEAPFVSTEVAAGVEADQARHLAQLRAKVIHRNFLGGLRKGTLDGAIGGVFLPTVFEHLAGVSPEDKRGLIWRIGGELVQPRIGLLPLDVVAGLNAAREFMQAFNYLRAGAHLAFPVHFDGWLRPLKVVPSVNFEQYWGDSTGTIAASTSACGPGTVSIGSLDCRILYGELRTTWDGRDDQIATRAGVFAEVSAQLAGTPLSEFAYARIQPELRVFVPLHERLGLALRSRYGALVPLGGREPPGVALFFAGGANSVRTTGAQQLGPRRYTLHTTSGAVRANVPAPIGGTRLLDGSVELRWRPTGGGLSLAAYVDGGALSTRDEWLPDPAYFQWGPGLGLRYHIEGVGPVRFDLAFRIPPFRTTPDAVDPGDTGESTDPARYTIAPRCEGESFTCYQETLGGLGVNFFLTLGEPF